MKIDAHHHLWDLSAVRYPWLMQRGVKRFFGDPKPIQRDYRVWEFRSDAAAHGFEASVHIQVGAADGEAEARWVQGQADANPGWPAAQVAFCDLTAADRSDRLDRLAALSTVRGIRQIVGRAPVEDAATGTAALLQSPDFLNGLRELAARGLSFDLQLIPELMDAAATLFAQVPELPVVLCHAGSPHDRSDRGLEFWRGELRKLSVLPNMRCKLSGLGMFDHAWTTDSIRPIVLDCLAAFGPERCMFGSNFPVDSLSSTYARLYAAYEEILEVLSAEERARVFGETAQPFYRI